MRFQPLRQPVRAVRQPPLRRSVAGAGEQCGEIRHRFIQRLGDRRDRVGMKEGAGAEFGRFLRLMREHENIWAKVTCPERLSLSGPPEWSDTVPFARALVEEVPDRVLWGTDWPHPNLKEYMPDDGQLVDVIPRIAATTDLQHRLLVDNPTRLFWKEN